ncbi:MULTISPECIES: DegT/DnrJ/EryC1/StrS family aminotransferase [Amycolatopsis]|uniref:dTDP-4-amino-4,6-dideoxygalactose transaminase n=2 Tax=Amycolatopsis TaxID=1813 RepID=A0A1I3UZ30_9PSEU|nr:DegT/DnrJ/EryC1/StrS family aminotransferase [Amycolatopsis sacchari]SFJ88468.1 dTDP-4-amino-4,6-dideoxygalactose transaminase [Amycolatopsis sacchari]
MIPLSVPWLAGNEARYLAECVEEGNVSAAGRFVERFEREFAEVTGTAHAVACASGTAALHVALRLAGAGPGRLVAVPTFTFIASANAATYCAADLLLVDSEPRTWNMDTARLHDEVVRRARTGDRLPDVVEVVHVLGHPADMEPLLALKDRFEIPIVEDAAEALGASWSGGPLAGRSVGSVGRFGCFSFNGNKIITSGAGGMIVTGEEHLAREARYLINQAKQGDQYVHETVGYNYRLPNLAAALGCAQLEQLADAVAARRALAARYRELLAGLPLTGPPSEEWARPSHWLYSVLVEDAGIEADELVTKLNSHGVGARRLWPPVHLQKPYARSERLGGAVAEDVFRRGLSLPSSSQLSVDEQRRVAAALRQSWSTPVRGSAQ